MCKKSSEEVYNKENNHEQEENSIKKKASIIAPLIYQALHIYYIMWIWNNIFINLFPLQRITIMQSLALDIVFAILISDFDNKMKAAPEKLLVKQL